MTSKSLKLILGLFFGIFFILEGNAQSAIQYDMVLQGGRVIDPETKLDAIRSVGIQNGRIAMISSEALLGKEIINVSGMVVAPGFIDLHVHGVSNLEQEYQLHDGVTTALELEWGIEHTGAWYASRQGKALIHYGASVNWPYERLRATGRYQEGVEELLNMIRANERGIASFIHVAAPSFTEDLTPEEMSQTLTHIKSSLEEGGIGIGVPIGYLPGTKPAEMYSVFEMAGQMDALVFTHNRQPNILATQEVIANAIVTGAPLHIVHINSMSLGQIDFALNMVSAAAQKGFDITTELYPYTAASTGLMMAMFDEGWQQRLGIDYGDLQLVATGERLTEETFARNRRTNQVVIMHMMQAEWIARGIAAPGVIIGSDGMQYSKLAHPRTAGTFSRILGKYVRENRVLDLNTAIEKMTLLPAKRLEGIAPMMRFKGRIQVGADADITVFDPNNIIDRATFEGGLEFSEGIEYVLVNGTFVLKNGKTVPNVFPGQGVYGKFKK
ncbi:amidohydrolase family protein [Shivajiella indica]|uniref:Amidohydrolase family protein n=1 Tax=Shivajiella indica TaxID=872115 RepID=A0ABW5B960_9BACT